MAKVFSIHEIELHEGTARDDFERFVVEEFLTAAPIPGFKPRVAKGDRGERDGKYALIMEIDSLEIRNRYFPRMDEPSEEGRQLLAPLAALVNDPTASGGASSWHSRRDQRGSPVPAMALHLPRSKAASAMVARMGPMQLRAGIDCPPPADPAFRPGASAGVPRRFFMEVLMDHAHLLLDVDPRNGINGVVGLIKGFTSHELRNEFPHLKKRIPTLWTRSKFISTVGAVTLDVV
jgi:Transposase IS200 like